MRTICSGRVIVQCSMRLTPSVEFAPYAASIASSARSSVASPLAWIETGQPAAFTSATIVLSVAAS